MSKKTSNSKRIKHNYTNELELKSIIIRLNNKTKNKDTTKDYNLLCEKYIKLHNKITNLDTNDVYYRKRLRTLNNKIKEHIIYLSENTKIDDKTYERFGFIILEMIKHILTLPNFANYSYSDDFYSDSVHKIIKYIHNFDHKKVSDITNQPVNSFAYVSQIIHNAIIYIINQKKSELEKNKNKVLIDTLDDEYNMKYINIFEDNREKFYISQNDDIGNTITIKTLENNELYLKLENIINNTDFTKIDRLTIIYPKSYNISFEEYDILSPILNSKISIKKSNI